MARMTFSSNNRVADIENFPKLKLEKNESARIVVIHEPEAAFVHNLRAPKMVNGTVQYKGEEMEFDFIGNPICLGDENTVRERGIDAKNCPACKAVQDAPDMFAAPKRRYATHVYQYQTNGSNKAPATAEGSVKVWPFADEKIGDFVDIYVEAEKGPKDVDLILGPCENPLFQKFKIIAGQKVAYQANDSTVARFEQAVSANQSKDLYRYIGRKMGKDFMTDKVDEVRRKWAQSKGQSDETSADGLPEPNLDAGISNLLDNNDPWAEAMKTNSDKAKSGNVEPDNFDDILAKLDE